MHSLGGVVLNAGSRLSAGGVPRKHAVGLCRSQRNDLFYTVFTVYDGAACFCRWRPADGQSAIRHCIFPLAYRALPCDARGCLYHYGWNNCSVMVFPMVVGEELYVGGLWLSDGI